MNNENKLRDVFITLLLLIYLITSIVLFINQYNIFVNVTFIIIDVILCVFVIFIIRFYNEYDGKKQKLYMIMIILSYVFFIYIALFFKYLVDVKLIKKNVNIFIVETIIVVIVGIVVGIIIKKYTIVGIGIVVALIIPCFVLGFLGGRSYTPISKVFRKFLNSITLQNVTAGYVILVYLEDVVVIGIVTVFTLLISHYINERS